MSDRRTMPDQCPTAAKEAPAGGVGLSARAVSAATGKSYWRSLDDLAGTREFRELLHREFPAHASELLDGSRRHFLRIMGASLALAGVAAVPGCRRPDHKIIAYNRAPEEVVPGKPLYYATAMPLPGGGCEGLLAETFEGRPTKLEGNPLHPSNHGKSSVASQASILDLYDPDRDPEVAAALAQGAGVPMRTTPWEEFVSFARGHFPALDASGGAGLAFLVEKATSPSRDALRDRVLARWPKASWLPYEPIDNESALEGTRLAFGAPMKEIADLSAARVVVSLDRDFLGGEGCSVGESRGFGAGRYRAGSSPSRAAADSEMSRLYVFESMLSLTGGQADHRWALKPSRIGAAALLLAQAVLSRMGAAAPATLVAALSGPAGEVGGDDLPTRSQWEAVAEDLLAHRGECVVLAGPSQPAEVHALACALNSALGAVGRTVRYTPVRGDAAASSLASIRALSKSIDNDGVETLVVIGCNPVYDAPAEIGFAQKYAKVRHTIHLGAHDETASASKVHLARSHYLESWSDVVSWEGVYSVVQPMIQPLFPSKGELEFLATVLGDGDTDPYHIVRATVRSKVGLAGFETVWRRTLHDGMAPGDGWWGPAGEPPRMQTGAVASALSGLAGRSRRSDGVELLFLASPAVHDGRHANNGWLQELPHAVTKVTWDNPLLMSPATAARLGLSTNRHPVTPEYCHGQMVVVTAGANSMELPLWPQPGLAEDTAVVHLGYGRRTGGRIAAGTGFDTYRLRSSGAMRFAREARIEVAWGRRPHLLACTQNHWTMEGRDILREIDLPRWQKFGDIDYSKDKSLQIDPYDRSRRLNFAGLMGMEAHTPANEDIYRRSQKQAKGLRFTEEDAEGNPLRDERGNIIPIKNRHGRRLQQWGMSIDLTTCSGCGACVVACQAENNIPIVGKMETAKGREMHWIRVDRYYATSPSGHDERNTLGIGRDRDIYSEPDMMVMPVTCVHCENAPCEVVCPVNATVHDEHGNNNMAYNRCIGTRYCSNNCPYKVRRFNFFDYATKQFRGSFSGQDLAERLPGIMQPPSEHFVPPRLRQKKLEVATMQYNPHVTVRSRGVMEKCTYCIQRVNAARIETKLSDLSHIPDGFMQTACEQACPTGAIVFGDIYDHDANEGRGSRVKQAREDGRSYQLLAYLNTRPRTTHMIRLRNPNPALADPERRARWDQPIGHHHHHDEHGSKSKGHVMSLPILNSGALA